MPESDNCQTEWISPGRAALILGVNPKTIARYADEGTLRVERRESGHRRVSRADVLRLRDERAGAPA